MSQRPWFPFYPGEYLADTAHLTTEEHGAYLLLLCHAWNHDGLIPEAESRRAAICKMHTNRLKKVWETLGGYWIETGGGYSNPRMAKELAKYLEIAEKRTEAGKRGGLAKALANAPVRARGLTTTTTTVEPKKALPLSPPSGGSPVTDAEGGNGAAPPCPMKWIQQGYNDLAADIGLPQCKTLTEKRKRHIAARWREYPDRESWTNFWTYVRGQPFLAGQNDRQWRCDLEWLVNPNNFAKVLEEKYVQ